MLRIRVQPVGVDVLLGPGERLLDAVDELSEPPLDFACRDATCGRCVVEVLRGATLLCPAASDERHMLAAVHAGATLRLGCQLRAGDLAGEAVLAAHRETPPG